MNDVGVTWPWPDPSAICSCGEPGCTEMGWGHEWDPIDCGDNCVLLCGSGIVIGDEYVRWGSGYAHRECAQLEDRP